MTILVAAFRGFTYTCNTCGTTHTQHEAGGYYTNSTPPGWAKVSVYRGESGTPMSERLLCSGCWNVVDMAVPTGYLED